MLALALGRRFVLKRILELIGASSSRNAGRKVSVLTHPEGNKLTFREGNAGAQLKQIAFFERQGAFHLSQMKTQQVA
jgi:hypothetical protein